MERSRFIYEDFESQAVSPEELDRLLAQGWRHAGVHFYRHNFAFHRGLLTEVIPLRILIEKFAHSRSQRRNWRTNAASGYRVVIRPSALDDEKDDLFQRHKRKFEDNIPDSLHDFLSQAPGSVPCEGREVAIYDGDRLISASFFDVGGHSISTIYGMYDLDYARCGLGIYTMLLEMEHARQLGKRYYYHGYCFRCPSFYDYKKGFRALQAFDWVGRWHSWAGSAWV